MSVLGVNDILRADPLARVEGEGASWLRTRISTVTTPSPNVAPLSTRTL